MSDVFSGTPVKCATPARSGWRLDFTQDAPEVIRARLRRGRGVNRNNVKDESGTVIIRNYVPLGRIEDVENNPKFSQWHARCADYRRHISGGDGVGVDSGTSKNGVAQTSRGHNPVDDIDRQAEWKEVRSGVLGVCH